MRRGTIALIALVLGIGLFAGIAVSEDEQNIALADCPQSVQDAITAFADGGEIDEAEVETENGVTVYEAEIEKDGVEYEIEVSEDGAILETEVEDTAKSDDDD